jgi:hypothetical protein
MTGGYPPGIFRLHFFFIKMTGGYPPGILRLQLFCH